MNSAQYTQSTPNENWECVRGNYLCASGHCHRQKTDGRCSVGCPQPTFRLWGETSPRARVQRAHRLGTADATTVAVSRCTPTISAAKTKSDTCKRRLP